MKYATLLFVLFSFKAISQLSGTISGMSPNCMYQTSTVTFTGSNGVAPYTFTYNVDGGTNQTITTTTGNSVDLIIQNFTPGPTVYNLILIEDATLSNQVLTSSLPITAMPIPIISAGGNQTVCIGQPVTITPVGAIVYNFNPPTITAGVPFVPSGNMVVSIMGIDQNGCSSSTQLSITLNSLPTIANVTIDSSICSDGSISILPNPNYGYQWMNGSSSPNLGNLAPGFYSVNVTDNTTGCTNLISYEVPLSSINGNCAEITGSIFFDLDQNCTINSGDSPLQNRIISANPGNYLAVTDQNGFYSFQLPVGTYSIQEVFNYPSIGSYCNLNYSVSLLNSTDSIGDQNFLDTLIGNADLQAYIHTSPLVSGFNFVAQLNYSSLTSAGSLLNADAWFVIPQGVIMQSWAYPHTISNDTVYFSLNTISSFYSSVVFANFLPLGQQVSFCTGIEILNGEYEINNNTFCYNTGVVGSFDPNDKTMFLNGVASDSTILLTDQKLDYVIRFQNTGTAPAQNIYILDTISSTLNLSSFEFVTSSFPCTISILDGDVLKFNFPSIMLPDSTNDEPNSHGFIHYRIRQNNQNTLGTIINNTAYIYFDFNSAVITNTTYDRIVIDDLGLNPLENFKVNLFPNPTNADLHIESDALMHSIKILSASGEQIKEVLLSDFSTSIDFSGYSKGIYFVSIVSENGTVVKRIVVQ